LIYDQIWGNFRVVDALLFGIGTIHFLLMTIVRRSWIKIPAAMSRPAAVMFCALLLGALHGRLNGGTHIFFDWREFVLAVFMIPVFAYWIRTERELLLAAKLFCSIMAVRAVYIILAYVMGGGVTDVIAGVRTPFFDGPTVSHIGLMGLIGFRLRQVATNTIERYYWLATALVGYLFVLVCFRRVYWGELFVGTFILVLLNRRMILKNMFLILFSVAIALAIAGGMIYQRLANVTPTASDPVYAATNLDHLNDVLDAFEHVREHPIVGIGVGVPYETFRILAWKTESWGVHNAILHVWLLYGLFGLLTYLWFHFRLFRWLRVQSRVGTGKLSAFAQLTFAFVVAQFLMTLGFAPWPYGSLQNMLVSCFLLGGILGVTSFKASFLEIESTAIEGPAISG
jgi:hypothetical protein